MFPPWRGPGSVGSFAGRYGGSALANAKGAAESIATAVADRSELARLLRRPEEPTPRDDGQYRLSILSAEECRALLARTSFGRLAYIARLGVPDIVPVNYTLEGDAILVRTGPGPKLQAAERRERVAFEVDELDADGTGCSVVVQALATRLTMAERQGLEVAVTTTAVGPRHEVIRLRPTRITGRRMG